MHTNTIELWGGVECTVNRVGDQFFDQLERNGHAWREDDLERFASLGLKALRYPILWERLAPERGIVEDWSWADHRLERLRELRLRPLVGLVHHGSGPRRTNLLDPGFAGGLADFARQVAERYPWIEDYTPVNEPLTTARFSALYGHWYPHTHDVQSFARAFVNQCKAVVLAMDAIRRVNPAARLVQTEDLGKTFSTEGLAGQAEFENQRRWLTFDLLGGHLDEQHPMWAFLKSAGIPERELGWFLDHPCPPDVMGINYYVTSERFLDERMHRYPAYARAGSGGLEYADMPAVRASAQGISGLGRLLREAWERYHLPLAITEAQLNCTREEQMRWFAEIWRDARALREQEGVDVRAVTLWALLGAFNWTNLLTRDDPDSYEPGAFDLRAPQPRPTALAVLARTLAEKGDTVHPVLSVPGWWRRPERFACEPAHAYQPLSPPVNRRGDQCPSAPLLITGAGSVLAKAFELICKGRALPTQMWDHRETGAASAASLHHVLDQAQPWAVIHATDDVTLDIRSSDAIDPQALAEACGVRRLPLLVFSLSRGIDGNDLAHPHEGVEASAPSILTIQTGTRFNPWDDHDAVLLALAALAEGDQSLPNLDLTRALSYLPDLVNGSLDLLLDGEKGVWRLSNAGTVEPETFLECARQAIGIKAPENTLPAGSPQETGAASPATTRVIGARDLPLPSWQSALRHLVDTRSCMFRHRSQ